MTVLTFPDRRPHVAPLYGPHEPTLEDMTSTGATYRRIDYWTRCGMLQPYDGPRPGSGNQRRWRAVDWRMVMMMTTLIDAGMTMRLAHDLASRAEAGDWTYETPNGVRIEWRIDW